MAFQWMRRVLLALAPAALLALAGCGSGSIESQFRPTRVVVFGDGLSDMGNTGKRYSVNESVSELWPKIVALDYGVNLEKSSAGGTNYATGNARVVLKPDAAGNAATPTIQEQIDAFLAANGSFGANDLVILQGGISDLIVQMAAFKAGTITGDQLVANAKQAGQDLATQAQRIKAAGAGHIVVMGTYDLSRTPWATAINQVSLLSTASTTFNSAVLVQLVNEGDKMLYVDAALLFNLMVVNPAGYVFTDVTSVACNSVDPGPGIGIGAGQVNSALCTPSTIVSTVPYTTALWADAVYPTPAGHSRLAAYVFPRVHNRW